ncbi:MAG: UpxY family transcription antiterminator [Planctomycetaceae bacterium]|nr:UpxY family transcription antiterminator [Planctomycetaceae bacterium]
MPILEREANLYPADLLTSCLEQPDAKWWALYTMSRQEKQLMRKLAVQKISYYCPIIEKKTRSPAGRQRTSFVPLFSNYVFLYGNEEARQVALTTNTISRCLEVENGESLRYDLHQLEMLLALGEPVSIESQLQPGTKVRVKSGPLKGASGTVYQRKGVDRLIISVNFLQQGASVELSDWEVEVCN